MPSIGEVWIFSGITQWLTRCQRDPTRTANFTKITRNTRIAKIRKISEGANENYENCVKLAKVPRMA